ncbi:MAG: DUF3037 domain-containing protein [Rhodothermales bacterium]
MNHSGDHKADWVDFDYAYLRVVPHVHLSDSEVVGIVLHSRTHGFIGIRCLLDRGRLASRWPSLDVELLEHELNAMEAIAEGAPGAGPIALLPPSDRFHWLTAPRSAVLQPTEVHAGRTKDPAVTLESMARAIGGKN